MKQKYLLTLLFFFISVLAIHAQVYEVELKGTAIGFEPDDLCLKYQNNTQNFKIVGDRFSVKAKFTESPLKMYIYYKKDGSYFPFYAEDTIMYAEIYKEDFYTKSKVIGSVSQDIYNLFIAAGTNLKVNLMLFEKYINTKPGIERINYLAKELPVKNVIDIYNKVSPEYKASVNRVKAVINTSNIRAMEVNAIAFPFTAVDQFGKEIKFNDNKFILLNFTHTNCPPCWSMYDNLGEAQKKYEDKLKIVSFHVDEHKQKWYEIAKKKGIELTYSSVWDIDKKQELLEIYNVVGFPLNYLIDNHGVIVARWFGNSKMELNKILSQNIK